MAKIIFWESPIDPNKKRHHVFKNKSMGEIFNSLGIEHETLSVSINGEFPEDIDFDYVPEGHEIVEIRRIVNGSDDAEGKNLVANIITIAALVAATILTAGAASPYLIAGITLISGVASGALRYRAAKILARSGTQDKGELDTATNNFSINAANNEARGLQSMTVVMGSHRFAPDYAGQPYGGFSGGVSTNTVVVTPNATSTIDIVEDLSSMDVLPAGFLVRPITWPPYDMAIMNELDLATITSFTLAQRRQMAPLFPTPLIGVPYSNVSMPIVLFHKDPLDPYYGRFTLLSMFENQNLTGKTLPQAIAEYEVWFLGPSYPGGAPAWYATEFAAMVSRSDQQWKLTIPLANPFIVPNTLTAIPDYLNDVINAGYTYPTLLSGFIPFRSEELVKNFIEPQSRDVIHTFNYGLGDLTVTDRAVEKTPLSEIIGYINDPITRVPIGNWVLPDIFTTFPPRPCITNVKILEGAALVNNTSFAGPAAIIPPNDFSLYNFVFRSTPKKTFRVEIDIEGSLYASNNTGIIVNNTTLEIQYRNTGDTNWSDIRLEPFRSSSTLPVRRTLVFNFNLSDSEHEFRIRKLELDVDNNEGQKIAALSMINFKCFVGASGETEASDMIGQTVESLLLVANAQTTGQTAKFTALVEAKCWVYDEALDVWNWEFSRNPAWWFLYFARGGFKNQDADGTYVFPWSPTYGWVNGPGHPSSTDTMFGCGLYDNEIDIETIKEWAIFCDDQNLFFDGIFRDDATSSEMLEKIANVGRGSTSYYKGILGVVYEDPEAIPSGLYGMGNIIEGSFSVDYSVINVPSKVIGTFTDRNDDWESKQVEAAVPFSDPTNLNFVTITLDGVTEEQQAQREVNILAARQYFQKRLYSWKVDHEGLIAKRGDLVYLSHDSTQYGWSGRIVKFLRTGDTITGLETTSEFKDTAITHVTIREPNGLINTYECSITGCQIIFIDAYPMNKAPQYPDGTDTYDNLVTSFSGTFPDDFIYLAGPKETPGKIVRISEIRSDQNMVFTLTAVDEDPAMWSYEYGPPIDAESFDDAELVVRVFNTGWQLIEPGLVKIFWETDGADFVKIINEKTGLPIESNGAFSFSGGQVLVELTAGSKYTLRIEPFVIGTPYAQKTERVVVWP